MRRVCRVAFATAGPGWQGDSSFDARDPMSLASGLKRVRQIGANDGLHAMRKSYYSRGKSPARRRGTAEALQLGPATADTFLIERSRAQVRCARGHR